MTHILEESTYTEHHKMMVDIVFEDPRNCEVIANLLYAWTSVHNCHQEWMSSKKCAGHLIGLVQQFPGDEWFTTNNSSGLLSSSQRLQQLVIHALGFITFQEYDQVEVEGFYKLLDCLHVDAKDIVYKYNWARLLLDAAQSAEGIQCLSHPYWELLVELSMFYSRTLRDYVWSPNIMASLERDQEWGKLECWIAVGWMLLGPSVLSESTEGDSLQIKGVEQQIEQWGYGRQKDLKDMTLSLFHQQPGAIQKLKQWMEQWSECYGNDVPSAFHQICEEAHIRVLLQGVL